MVLALWVYVNRWYSSQKSTILWHNQSSQSSMIKLGSTYAIFWNNKISHLILKLRLWWYWGFWLNESTLCKIIYQTVWLYAPSLRRFDSLLQFVGCNCTSKFSVHDDLLHIALSSWTIESILNKTRSHSQSHGSNDRSYHCTGGTTPNLMRIIANYPTEL